MKYGLYLPNFGPFSDAQLLAELARDAEAAGWHGFFLWDHVTGFDLPMVDPWIALTAVAAATQRIMIGTTVTPLPRRRPWKVARETASLDRFSGGRLVLGVGIGLGAAEWGNLGEEANLKKRAAMLDESLELLVGLWRGEPVRHEGQHYELDAGPFIPTPMARPERGVRVPIWVGGIWPNKGPFRRAARWDGMFPLFQAESEEEELAQLRQAISFVQERRPDNGPFDVVCTGSTPGDREAAALVVAPYARVGATWWLEAIAPYRFGEGYALPWRVAALRERIIQGPPGG